MNVVLIFVQLGYGGIEKKIYQISNELAKELKVTSILCIFDSCVNEQAYLDFRKISKVKVFCRDKSIFSWLGFDLYALMIMSIYRPASILSFLDIASVPSAIYAFFNPKAFTVICEDALTSMYTRYHTDAFKTWKLVQAYRMVDYFIVSSSAISNEIANYFGVSLKKIKLIPNWSLLSAQKDEVFNIDKPIDFLFIGRFEYQKNVFLLLKIIYYLTKVKSNIRCVLVGKGSLHSQIQTFIKDHGIEKNITVLISVSEPKEYLLKSRFLLITSHYEGFPLIAAESLSVGTPIISTYYEGVEDVIENNINGFICYTKVDFFKKCLLSLSLNKHLYQSLQSHAITSARKKFSAKNIETYVEILTQNDI
jgi:glycosyltransferase involved in cell wall biosynthesis